MTNLLVFLEELALNLTLDPELNSKLVPSLFPNSKTRASGLCLVRFNSVVDPTKPGQYQYRILCWSLVRDQQFFTYCIQMHFVNLVTVQVNCRLCPVTFKNKAVK